MAVHLEHNLKYAINDPGSAALSSDINVPISIAITTMRPSRITIARATAQAESLCLGRSKLKERREFYCLNKQIEGVFSHLEPEYHLPYPELAQEVECGSD